MTVKQLREALVDLPDFLPIFVETTVTVSWPNDDFEPFIRTDVFEVQALDRTRTSGAACLVLGVDQ